MGMLESISNHVIGLYTMLKISGIKNFNITKYPIIQIS